MITVYRLYFHCGFAVKAVQTRYYDKPTSEVKSNLCPEKLLTGDEGDQRGFQTPGADGLSLGRLPADVAVLAPGSLQEAALRRHRQPAGQAAAEPRLPEDHRRLRPTVRFIYIPDKGLEMNIFPVLTS